MDLKDDPPQPASLIQAGAGLTGAIATALLQPSLDCMIVIDQDNLVVEWNPAAEQVFSYSRQDALGKNLSTLIIPPAFREGHERGMRRYLTTRISHISNRFRVFAQRRNGDTFPCEIAIHPLEFSGSTFFAAVLRDISEQIRTDEILRESEERYRTIFDQAALGIAHVSVKGHWERVNQTLCRILGYPHEDLLALTYPDVTHPDDLEQVKAHAELLLSDGVHTSCIQHRFVRRDQSVVWVKVTSSVMRKASGEAQSFIAMVEDITEIQRAEEELRLAAEDLERRVEARTADLTNLSEQLQTQVLELEQRNRETRLLGEMSDMLQACLTISEVEQVVAQHASELFPGVGGALYAFESSRTVLQETVSWNGGSSSSSVFVPVECWGLRRGRPFSALGEEGLHCRHSSAAHSTLCIPMLAQGETVGLLHLEAGSAAPLTRRQERLAQTVAETAALAIVNLRLRESLHQQSIRDPLTGLYNRRYLEESFERELHRAQRSDDPIAVIMLDIDRFKHFNDSHGHEAGDDLLRALGQLLSGCIRVEDVACRYGGEEFALVFPGMTLDQATRWADQLRHTVESTHFASRGEALEQVSVSLGVAAFPQHGRRLADLIRAADAALYGAKREGRNRVVTADEAS